MKAIEAYRLAIKRPQFNQWKERMYKAVADGKATALSFQFIVDGKRYYFGYMSVYDAGTKEHIIRPICGRLVRFTKHINLTYVNPVLIR